MFDILFYLCTLVCVSSVVNQMRRHWIIFKTFKSKILSSLCGRASESLINSTFYSFPALFTYCLMHKMMSHSMFPYFIISCDLRLRTVSSLLSPAVIASLLSHYSWFKMYHSSSLPSCEMLRWLMVCYLVRQRVVVVFHLARCWVVLWYVILWDNELCVALVFHPTRCELTHSLLSCGMMVVFWS
jgi:hypothetical protein